MATLAELMAEQVVRLAFLKQIRDAEHGDLAVVQQVVEARSSVLPGSLRWRRLRGSYELSVERLASHPLEAELGLAGEQTVRLAFAAEFGFRMESGVVQLAARVIRRSHHVASSEPSAVSWRRQRRKYMLACSSDTWISGL